MITTPEQMREEAAALLMMYVPDERYAKAMSDLRAIPIAPQPATDWTTCAADMLRVWDTWFGGSAGGDHAAADRLAIAASFAAQAFEHAASSGITADGAPTALLRAFLLALADHLHPDLDYLRADPASGEKARTDRGAVAPTVVAAPQPVDAPNDLQPVAWRHRFTHDGVEMWGYSTIKMWDTDLPLYPAAQSQPATQPMAVTVKPLVWVADPDNEGDYGFFRAWAGVYCYEVGVDAGWWWQEDAAVSMAAIDGFPSPDVAQAAAQADYEARILSALTIQPADPLSDPRVKALVEAAKNLADVCSVVGVSSSPSLRRMRAALRAIGGEA